LRTVEGLRARSYSGAITVISSEDALPYDRPPLSKQFLAGAWDEDRIRLRSDEEIRALNIDLHRGVKAESFDLERTCVRTTHGEFTGDAIVFATGSRARTLPGTHGLSNVFVVRSIADSKQLQERLVPDAKVVVIGAGFIGAEVAATAKARGANVTILEAALVPLQRQLGNEMGAACGALHARNGVTLQCGVTITHVDNGGVTLANGDRINADCVVVGVGAAPNTEWLEGSGVALRDGVLCNNRGQVLDENGDVCSNIVVAGDIARFPHDHYPSLDDAEQPEFMRLEHWTNAAEMADHVAGTLMGEDLAYRPVPYFWSDQYTHKIQFLGRSTGFDEVRVVAGDPNDGAWLALYRRGDRLIGALGVSKIRALMPYRALLAQQSSWVDALAAAPTA
jgi:NADPH-dependent 2,4-dienoyl-CoA reductase/sulfur reductase-like enzyme